MIFSFVLALFSSLLLCDASQPVFSSIDVLKVFKSDGTLLNGQAFHDNPERTLQDMLCRLEGNDYTAMGLLCHFLHEKEKEKFEHSVIDFLTSASDEVKKSVTVSVLDTLLPNFEGFAYFFEKCRHSYVDMDINDCFVKAFLKRVSNGDIKLADAFVIILHGLIRKGANKTVSEEQAYFFGDNEIIEDPTAIIEHGFKALLARKNGPQALQSVIDSCLQGQNAELSRLRNQYLHGVPIADTTIPLTDKQRFTNFLILVALPTMIVKCFEQLSKGKVSLTFILLRLLKAHDHLKVMPEDDSLLDHHLVTELLMKVSECSNNGIVHSLVDSIRRCSPDSIDEDHYFFKKLSAKKAALDPKPSIADMQAPVVSPQPTVNPTIADAIKYFYTRNPQKLQYFTPELLSAQDMTESERNCLLAFEVSFGSCMAKLLSLAAAEGDGRVALRDRLYHLIRKYANNPVFDTFLNE